MRSTSILIITLVLTGVGCATTGRRPTPAPFPRPGGRPDAATAPSTAPAASGSLVADTALSLTGTPYRLGGADPSGFDCSGLVQYAFARHGVTVPRLVIDQYQVGTPIELDALAPGDLVFFSTVAPGASHVGIALGDRQFVHAPTSRGWVRIESLDAEYWRRRYVGARRPPAGP